MMELQAPSGRTAHADRDHADGSWDAPENACVKEA